MPASLPACRSPPRRPCQMSTSTDLPRTACASFPHLRMVRADDPRFVSKRFQNTSSSFPSLIYAKRSSLHSSPSALRTDPLEVQFKHFDGLSCPEPYAYPTPQAPCPDNLLPLAFRSVESVWSVSLAVHPSRAAGRVGTPSFAMIPAAADRARPRGVRLEVRTRHCLAG